MWRAPLSEPKYADVSISYADEGKVAIVALNRPKKYNALNFDMFFQLKECFEYLGRSGSEVRAIVFTGTGKHFTAGIDLFAVPQDLQALNEKSEESDPGRAAVAFYPVVKAL